MKPVRPELLEIISRGGHMLTTEADDSVEELELEEVDTIEVAMTGELHKKTRDPHREAAFIWTILGKDTGGRALYMAGKVIRRHGETIWKIITIHQSDS